MNKTLSLCIIAKDSEKTISECLNSVVGIVDEIVLIDTGSTDATKKIANNFNARIFDFKWNDNFSDARNFALSKITTDWILILDSDEVLAGNKDNIRALINQNYGEKTPLYFLDIFTNINKFEKKVSYFQRSIRLFPKSTNILFKNSIHEELIHPEGTKNLQGLSAIGMVIKHFQEGGPKDKSKRNVLIIKKELKLNPNSFTYNYLMAKECTQHELFEKGLKHFQLALNSEDEKNEILLSDICTEIIKILFKTGQSEEALNECIRRQELCQDNPEYWLTYGYIALREGDFNCAKDNFEKCLTLDPPADLLTIEIDNITWKPEMLLGYTQLRLQNYEQAKIHFENALLHNENNWSLLFYLGVTCKNLKEYDLSEDYINSASMIAPEEFKSKLNFSMLLMNIMNHNFDKANDLVKIIVAELGFAEDDELHILEDF